MNALAIRTHVGRDILQSAQSFRTPEAAIWEYVVNSLQYRDPGVTVEVRVTLDHKRGVVVIDDNGSGMDSDGLKHFFTMHGENLERRKGVPGRGKFGTGKSAAFGIGNELVVDTVRNELRQVVRVTREMIEAADGNDVPVDVVTRDEYIPGAPNGTTITISAVTAKLSRDPVVSLIERHLSTFRNSAPVVTVDGRICQIPTIAVAGLDRTFAPPSDPIRERVGDITLNVRISRTPLSTDARGIAITVGQGNLVAVEAAGVDTKEYGDRLFGEIDCPELDNPSYDPISPYGNNRDLRLNPSHPVAAALTAFIGSALELVRQELVAENRQARQDAAAKRLRTTTDEIASVLNADLEMVRDRIEGTMANTRLRSRLPASAAGEEPDDQNFAVDPEGDHAGEERGVLGENVQVPDASEPSPTDAGGSGGTSGGENASPAGRTTPDGTERLISAGGSGKRRPRGGLEVRAEHLGADFDRTHWDKDNRVIIINLDHPVVVAARALNDNEVTLRRLIYEISFTAYAIALAELQLERDEAMTASDATFEVRAALRRVWAHAASLYAT